MKGQRNGTIEIILIFIFLSFLAVVAYSLSPQAGQAVENIRNGIIIIGSILGLIFVISLFSGQRGRV